MKDTRRVSEVHAVDQHVAEKLRKFRVKAGFSQKKLAECANISFQQLQKYESVKNKISIARLFDFSQILQISIGSFFDGLKCKSEKYSKEEEGKIDGKCYSLMLSIKECLPLIEAYGRIENEEIRKNILQLVENISDKDK